MTQITNNGSNIIKKHLQTLPFMPGVYRMLDAKGKALYIGKAKSLRNRVRNYLGTERLSIRLQRMVYLTCDMDFVVTTSETEALLLEANMIKSQKPPFNILLRDDKSYPEILINKEQSYARLMKHRGKKNSKGSYFGPFASSHAVDSTIESIQKAFLLRTCSPEVYKNRKRPCLLYQIKRCSAPCTSMITKEEYQENIKEAEDFLKGKSINLQKKLMQKLHEESNKQEYEKAAVIRDRLAAIAKIRANQKINSNETENMDLVICVGNGKDYCIAISIYRYYQFWGTSYMFPFLAHSANPNEVLEHSLSQHYSRNLPAPMIITNTIPSDDKNLENILSKHVGAKVSFKIPQKGKKKLLLDRAIVNAQEALARHQALKMKENKLILELGKLIGIDNINRIEVFDNAHTSGTNSLGGMIVLSSQGFEKNQYRLFNITNEHINHSDDYSMMKEVLTRHLKRLQKVDDNDKLNYSLFTPNFPDLIVLDGGKGQLNIGKNIIKQHNLKIKVIAIAKGVNRNAGDETIYIDNGDVLKLSKKSHILHFLQRIRDEAHRYVNGAHSRRRKKSMLKGEIENIPFIGKTRKRQLLTYFGSLAALKSSSIDDIAAVPGFGLTLAKKIYNNLHNL